MAIGVQAEPFKMVEAVPVPPTAMQLSEVQQVTPNSVPVPMPLVGEIVRPLKLPTSARGGPPPEPSPLATATQAVVVGHETPLSPLPWEPCWLGTPVATRLQVPPLSPTASGK